MILIYLRLATDIMEMSLTLLNFCPLTKVGNCGGPGMYSGICCNSSWESLDCIEYAV